MDEEIPDFRATLNAVLEESDGLAQGHLTPDLLVAYHHGSLASQEADAALDHLAACRHCGDLLLELKRFGDSGSSRVGGDVAGDSVGSDNASLDDLESARSWRSLHHRFEDERTREASGIVAPGEVARARHLVYGLAASLALTALGLSTWVGVLQSELRALRQPQVNLPIVNLEAIGITRGDGERATIRGGAERFVVILNPPAFPADVDHRVEILDSADRSLWTGEELRPTVTGTFHLELSRHFLPPGDYRIRLRRGDEVTAELALRVAP